MTSSRPKHASGALAHLRGGAIASASANVSKSNTTSHPAKMLQVQSPNATTHQSQGIYVQTRINLTNESSFAAVLRSWGPGGDASKSGGDASDRSPLTSLCCLKHIGAFWLLHGAMGKGAACQERQERWPSPPPPPPPGLGRGRGRPSPTPTPGGRLGWRWAPKRRRWTAARRGLVALRAVGTDSEVRWHCPKLTSGSLLLQSAVFQWRHVAANLL